MRHIGPPVKAVHVKFASKVLILYVISRPESCSVSQEKRRPRSVCAVPRRKNLYNPSATRPVSWFREGQRSQSGLGGLLSVGLQPWNPMKRGDKMVEAGGVASLRGPSSVDSQARDEKVPEG